MYYLNSLLKEHENIANFISCVEIVCLNIFENKTFEIEEMEKIIIYIEDYVENYHYIKEEKFLFKEMQEKLPEISEKIITHGMLVEHDLSKLYLSDIKQNFEIYKNTKHAENLLNIISNLICYSKMIKRHAEKENNAVFQFGNKNLDKKTLEGLNARAQKFDLEMQNEIKKCEDILNYLTKKYLKNI